MPNEPDKTKTVGEALQAAGCMVFLVPIFLVLIVIVVMSIASNH